MECIAKLAATVWRKIPFVGELGECSRKDVGHAFIEVVVTALFSTLPLWLLPLFGHFMFKSNANMLANTYALAKDGELFLYAAACLGPLMFIIARRYGEIRRQNTWPSLSIQFPYGMWFLFSILGIGIFCGLAFGILRLPGVQGIKNLVDPSNTIKVSFFCYLFSLFLLFVASAYRNRFEEFSGDPRVAGDGLEDAKWERVKHGA